MNRRWLLSLLCGGIAALSGCIGDEPPPSSPAPTNTSSETPTSDATPEPPSGGTCGPASERLAARLTDEPGADECPEDLYPSLIVANDREESITAQLTFDGVEQVDEEVDLAAGEQAIRDGMVPSADGLSVTVTILTEAGSDEQFSETWPSSSCKRHAVRIGDDSITVGYVDPLSLPADAQHDCYAGDPVDVSVYNRNEHREMTVLVDDRCAGKRVETELSVASGAFEQIPDALENGGVYDITVVLADGTVETYGYEEDCWDIEITIETADEIHVRPVGID